MSHADPRPRFVLLGASNASQSIATIVSLARGAHDVPIEILAAHGRGRSFAGWSRAFFVRELPGINECGLWPVLRARSAPTTALVCDLGNDLMYGATPATIACCLADTLSSLRQEGARTVVMRLPLESLQTLGPTRFRIIQRVIFPARPQQERDHLLECATELDRLVQVVARDHGAALATPRGSWYGFDPIHILRAHRLEAWTEVLSTLWPVLRPNDESTQDRRALRCSRPLLRKMFGREQRAVQPSASFGDGSTLAWY